MATFGQWEEGGRGGMRGVESAHLHAMWPGLDPGPVSYLSRPFPSSLVPLFQSESKCETILMKMTLIA